MDFSYLAGLLGGLALFLYGMQMMSTGLEAAAGNRMKVILEKLTANRLIGVLAGALITAVIQSSSATTVMVVGFVNSGMMALNQAVWIIMGANIGTTITGQLIALKAGDLAQFLAFFGVTAIVFLKNEKLRHGGEIFAGLGILFMGMDLMGSAMKPLAGSQAFVGLLTRFANPVLGILAGTVFTALIQSSSASIGILQALADSGAIGLRSAAFVLFGQNIGTCVTALLASAGTGRNARQTTLLHILFNVIGTVLFTVLCLLSPIIPMVEAWTPANASAQIANLHTLFNVGTTLLLLPMGTGLTKLAAVLIRDKKKDGEPEEMRAQYLLDIKYINAEKLGASVICVEGIKKELQRMMEMAGKNVAGAFDLFAGHGKANYGTIERREDYVDYLNKEISRYITSALSFETTKAGSRIFNSLFSAAGNIERISDHAVNIAGYSKQIAKRNIVFSRQAKGELAEMKAICEVLFEILLEKPADLISWHEKVVCLEQKIDDMTIRFRDNMYGRIQRRTCSDEGSILFSEMLTDFERIGDHALNISDDMLKLVMIEG